MYENQTLQKCLHLSRGLPKNSIIEHERGRLQYCQRLPRRSIAKRRPVPAIQCPFKAGPEPRLNELDMPLRYCLHLPVIAVVAIGAARHRQVPGRLQPFQRSFHLRCRRYGRNVGAVAATINMRKMAFKNRSNHDLRDTVVHHRKRGLALHEMFPRVCRR